MIAVCQCLLNGIFLSSLPCLQCIVIIDGGNSRYAEDLLFLCKYKCFIWFCLTGVFILKQHLEIYTSKTFYGCTKQTIQKPIVRRFQNKSKGNYGPIPWRNSQAMWALISMADHGMGSICVMTKWKHRTVREHATKIKSTLALYWTKD